MYSNIYLHYLAIFSTSVRPLLNLALGRWRFWLSANHSMALCVGQRCALKKGVCHWPRAKNADVTPMHNAKFKWTLREYITLNYLVVEPEVVKSLFFLEDHTQGWISLRIYAFL